MFSLNTKGVCRLLAPVFGLLAVFFVLGCPMSSSSGSTGDTSGQQQTYVAPPTLIGSWASASDSYTITSTTVTYKGFDSQDYGKFSFTGTIKNSPNFTAASGVIIVEYSQADKPSATSGNFQAVYWKSLTANSVSMANAYDPSGSTEAASLSAAQVKFTADKANTYVTWSVVQPQAKK